VNALQYLYMRIAGLALQYFRLHKSLTIQFEQPVTLIIGSNASGKTSILEAISLLSTGKSFRALKIAEMVALDQELARVKGVVQTEAKPSLYDQTAAALAENSLVNQEQQTLEILLTKGLVNGQRAAYRLFSVNEVRRQQRKATGILKVVVFRPEDMRLVEGSPGRRRSYFDAPLAMLYDDYEQALKSYEQVLKRRNKLLLLVGEGKQSKSVLEYWNINLIKHGEVIQEYRRKFISLAPTVTFPIQLQMEYQPSVISEERIKQYLEKEIAAGHTLIGPHKDDFFITYLHHDSAEPLNIALYGSRGQQRLAVLWLKLVELAYVEQQAVERPVLLLDDIFSELDPPSQSLILDLITTGQTIITTIDPDLELFLHARFDGRLQVVRMEERSLTE